MAFQIEFTQTAADHVRAFREYDQKVILNAIEEQLRHEPTVETRNKKPLSPNELSDWELRVDQFRVFSDVTTVSDAAIVTVKVVGRKQHNKLMIGGEEVPL
jgi:mRNA-degrading endonuclease RelE of RelBE toxin-antitoxin system